MNSSKKLFGVLFGVLVFLACIVEVKGIEITTDEIDNLENNEINLNIGDTLTITSVSGELINYCQSNDFDVNHDENNKCVIEINDYAKSLIVVNIFGEENTGYSKYFYINSGIEEYMSDIINRFPDTIEGFNYDLNEYMPHNVYAYRDFSCNPFSSLAICNVEFQYNYSTTSELPNHISPYTQTKEVEFINNDFFMSNSMITRVGTTTIAPINSYINVNYNDIIFVSTDTSVATIDQSGEITAKSAGNTTIKVYNKKNFNSDELVLTVLDNKITPDEFYEMYNNKEINININNEDYYLSYEGNNIVYDNLISYYFSKEYSNLVDYSYSFSSVSNILCSDNVCDFDLTYYINGQNSVLHFMGVTINLEGLYLKMNQMMTQDQMFLLDYFNFSDVSEDDISLIYDNSYFKDNLDGTYTPIKAGKTEVTLVGGGYTTTETVYIRYPYSKDEEISNYLKESSTITLPYSALSFANYQNLDVLENIVKNKIIANYPDEEVKNNLTADVYCFSSNHCQFRLNVYIDGYLLLGSHGYELVNIEYTGYEQMVIDELSRVNSEILDEYNIDVTDTIKHLNTYNGDEKLLFDSIISGNLGNIDTNYLEISYEFVGMSELINNVINTATYKINFSYNNEIIASKDVVININPIVNADATLEDSQKETYLKEYVDNILMSDVVVSNLYDNVYTITNNDYSFNLMLDKKEAILITNVSLNENIIELNVGDTKPIEYRIYPIGATYGVITFTSGNEDILSVSEDGIITAHKKGFTYVDIKVNYSATKLMVAVGMSAKEGLNELLNSINKNLNIDYSELNIGYYGNFDEALKNTIKNKINSELLTFGYYNFMVDAKVENDEYYVRIKTYNSDEYSDYQKVTYKLTGIHLSNNVYTISSGETIDTELFFTEGDNLNLYTSINNSDIISYDNNGLLTGLKTGVAEVSINDKYKNYYNYFTVIVNYDEYINNLFAEMQTTDLELDYNQFGGYNTYESIAHSSLYTNYELYYLIRNHNIVVDCDESRNICTVNIYNDDVSYEIEVNVVIVGIKLDEKEVHLDLNEEKEINYEPLNDTSNVEITSLNEDICTINDNKIKGIAPGFCTVKYSSDKYVNYQHIIVDEVGIINDYQEKLNNIPDNIEIPIRNFDVNNSDIVYDSSNVLQNLYYSYMQQYILDYIYPDMSMNDLMYKLGEVNFNYEDNYIYDTHTSTIKITPSYYFTDDDYFYSLRLDDSVSKDVVITPVNASDEYIKLGNEIKDVIKTQYTLTLKQYLMYELNGREMDMIFYSSFQEDLYNVCPTCEFELGQGGLGDASENYLMQGMEYMILKDGVPIGYYLIEVIADMRVLQEDAVLSEDEFIELIEETVKEEYIAAKEELEISRVARMANTLSNEDDIYVNVEKVFDATIPDLYDITVEDINFQTVVNTTVVGEEQYTYSVTDIIFSESAITLDVGESKIIGYTIVPDNATNKDILWESSNPSIVSVDASGAIIARSPGNATITVKSKDGNTTKTINVTVNASETPEIEVTLGDINLDGAINMTDLIKLRKYFAGLETLDERALKNADINKDGTVNMTDIIKLRKYFAGLEDLK